MSYKKKKIMYELICGNFTVNETWSLRRSTCKVGDNIPPNTILIISKTDGGELFGTLCTKIGTVINTTSKKTKVCKTSILKKV